MILPGPGRGTAGRSPVVEGARGPVVRAEWPLHPEQVRSAPRCAAMSGGHGDLLIAAGPPPRSGEDL